VSDRRYVYHVEILWLLLSSQLKPGLLTILLKSITDTMSILPAILILTSLIEASLLALTSVHFIDHLYSTAFEIALSEVA